MKITLEQIVFDLAGMSTNTERAKYLEQLLHDLPETSPLREAILALQILIGNQS